MSSEIPSILGEKRAIETKWLEKQAWKFNPFAGDDKRLPDPKMFANYKEELRQAITAIDDFVNCYVVGSYGTGKSTFINYLLDGLPKKEFKTAFIEKPSASARNFFMKALTDFAVDFKTDDTVGGLFSRLVTEIREFKQDGKKCVIAVDEVADAPVEIMQWIRVLSDESLSFVFVGYNDTPSIVRERFYPLYDRIFKTIELKGLTLEGIAEFVARRVRVASNNPDWNKPFTNDIAPFEREAIDILADNSGGAPRYLWRACYVAVAWAMTNDKHLIDAITLRNILRSRTESVFATITRRQRDVAELLWKRGPIASPEIAKSLQISTAAVDGLLKPLEEAEILRKVGKRKAYEYSLTPMAERYLAKEEQA